jgi:leucyl-tRNA synthetase
MKRYNPSEIEPKWQKVWEDKNVNRATVDKSKNKMYVSGMFPYPSGVGMHTGHAFSYAIVDAIARFYRQHDYNVLTPMGWDTFGLPAENFAIKTGTAPAIATATNIANFKNQFKRMGVSIDWSREISTSDPEYYRWTQWVFTKLFERGLAYQKESLQWWCPVDKTVLANEQVEGGHCWRCGTEVIKKSMKQWFFKITDYADALLDEIPDLEWPNKVKVAQTNWIGKSEGAEIEFKVDGSEKNIIVFTTRPDTIFGVTFVAVAPEHPLAKKIAVGDFKESVESYVAEAIKKSEIERMNDSREKTGVFTGSFAINPATGERIPIWVADYVLSGYGTSAIMAVPAHDERDYAFAEKFSIPIKEVVLPHRIDDINPPKQEKKTVERQTIHGIVHNPITDKYLCVQWKKFPWTTFVVGGVEPEDDDVVAAARREIMEETGYKNIKLSRVLGGQVVSEYYAAHKDVNRKGYVNAVLFELIDDEKSPVSEEEQSIQTPVWLSLGEITKDRMTCAELDVWLDRLNTSRDMYRGEGVLINSGVFDGMESSDAREEIVAWLEKQGMGRSKITYKMRDWLISRQRYWGAPIPIIHCPEHGAVAVPEDQLPVLLPEIEDYAPKGDGKSALASATDWVNTTCPKCGKPAMRETDTMDGYACSSWYLLRYTDPNNSKQAWDPKLANYWAPVDYYIGGDHAVAHLLYVRFWTHVFNEMGLTNFKEPIKKLVYHGYINAEDGTKMSKSKGNVIDPLDVIDQGYGADALRTYVLFMGPIELDAAWNSRGIAGVYRFLNRIWVLVQEYLESDKKFTGNDDAVLRLQNKATRKVTEDFYRLSFNTAISALMEYTNQLYKLKVDGFSNTVWRQSLQTLVQLVAPFAPHIADELWQQLGGKDLVQQNSWPIWDDKLITSENMTIVVQVNGKLRAKFEIAADASEEDVKKLALKDENVKTFVGDKTPVKIIYVPGKLVNIVVAG